MSNGSNRNAANAIPVFLGGSTPLNLTTNLHDQVADGPGVASGLNVNTAGTTSSVKLYDGTSSVVTLTLAVPGVVHWTDHPFVAGEAVEFTTTGAVPTGLTAGTKVYVSTVGLTADAFSVADTAAHALAGTNTITFSGSQSGVQTGWDTSHLLGTFDTTALGNVPFGVDGWTFAEGLIAVTAGGAAADITIAYR
jgi:hypothetical protein